MKTYNKLFENFFSEENLLLAFKKARKGRSKKWYVKDFEANIENELEKLKVELETQTYRPRQLKRFVVRDPKTRVVYASHFRDRVVHHALCNLIEPIFEKIFIQDSYANRKNKGTQAALDRFDRFKRISSRNGNLVKNARDSNMVVGYALKADIKHYFQTVDHQILIKILKRKIQDEKVLWLIGLILENHEDKTKSKGMPIGNLTSQFFANVYLNELDYFVKHILRVKNYIRYVDDFVILHRSREKLVLYKWFISNFLKSLKLELHPDKSRIISLQTGVDMLGFKIFYHYKIPRRRNIRNFYRKINFYESSLRESLIRSVEGWFGYAIHDNTYKLRKRILDKIESNI